ncbi:MAG: peptide ABC transporter substrate-binding protein [Nitrolancea sp.]
MDTQRAQQLYENTLGGALNRRQVLKRAAALGLSAPAIAALVAACGGGGNSTTTSSTSTTSSGAGGGTGTPSSGSGSTPGTGSTAAAGRAKGGDLKLLWWQAPTILNSHLSQGTKDFDASRPILEPLADFDKDGNPVPILAAEIPSLDNSGVSKDGLSVTWKLKQNVTWSDGQPFTAEDVKFTYEYVSNPDTSATTAGNYVVIDSVEAVDQNTVKINFKNPTPGWFGVFCGDYGRILPQHILKDAVGANARNAPFNLKPVGTGPYVVSDFQAGDHVYYAINDKYRDAGKPFFKTVNLKGGGDATSAARAAIQTGEVDFSWNLQVEADVLTSLSGPGRMDVIPGVSVERVLINMTDPNQTVDGQKSHLGTPHPFQSDQKVRQAYALAVQRDVLVKQLYGPAGSTTSNILVAPTDFISKNTSWKYDTDAANKLLDDAGWTKNGNTRAKNGVQMKIIYSTSVNDLRQKEQEIVKQGLTQIGIDVTLKTVDASVFFSSDAGNVDTAAHFYVDIEMYTNGPTIPYPLDYMVSWWGAPSNIPQKENNWAGNNYERWQNADFDKAYTDAQTQLDTSKQPDLFIQMNDLVVNQVVEIPLVLRNTVSGVNQKLQNLNLSPWVSNLWNLENWTMSS